MPLDNSYNTYKFIKKNLIHLHISANWSESSLSTWIKAWILGYLKSPQLAWVAQLNVCLTVEQAFAGSTPLVSRQHSFVEIDHEIFSTVILSILQIQERQLSVSGKRMCTILINSLKNYASPVKVWLGKLTALDMTPMGLLGHKTSRQTKSAQQTLLRFHRCAGFLSLGMVHIIIRDKRGYSHNAFLISLQKRVVGNH